MSSPSTLDPAALEECVAAEQRSLLGLRQALAGLHTPPLRRRVEALAIALEAKIEMLRAELRRQGASVTVAIEPPVLPAPELPQDVRKLLSMVADWQRELWSIYGEWVHDCEGYDRDRFDALRDQSMMIRAECHDLAMLI
jgi:hypothetical protein